MKKLLISLANNSIVHVMAVILISFVIFLRPLIEPGYPMWADDILPVLNMQAFADQANFVYSEKYNGLVYNPVFVSFYFLLHKVFSFLSVFIKDNKILSYFWIFLPYVSLYTVMYLVLKKYFFKPLISFALTLFYMFSILNFSWIIAGWSTTTYSQAGSFIFFTLFLIYLKKPNIYHTVLMVLASIVAILNVAYFYSVAIICLFSALLYFLTYGISLKQIFKKYYHLFILPILIGLLNMFWLLPIPAMLKSSPNSLRFEDIYSPDALSSFNSLIFSTSISEFTKYGHLFQVYNFVAFKVIMLVFVISAILFALKRVTVDKDLRLLLAIYLFIFCLSQGENLRPLWSLIQQIPGAFIIRGPQIKFYSMLFFVFMLIVGRLVSLKEKYFTYLFCFVVFIQVLAFVHGDIFDYFSNQNLPKDYFSIISHLNNPEAKYKTIMVFPKFKHNPMLRWLENQTYSYLILDQYLNNPLILYLWGDQRVPPELRYMYEDDVNYDYNNLVNNLGSKGVKYILGHKDGLPFTLDINLEQVPGVSKVIEGKNLVLYEIDAEDFVPEVYRTDSSENLEWSRLSPVKYKVANPSGVVRLNKVADVNWNMYSPKNNSCNLDAPGLNFCDLVFLFSSNLPKNDGKSNTWSVKTGSSDVYIYYTPQLYLYIGIIISSASFIVLLIILLRNRGRYRGLYFEDKQ